MNAINTIFEYSAISEPNMVRLGSAIAGVFQSGDVIALSGDLGSGKTTLARAIIQAISPYPVDVTSPTFTLMQEYPYQSKDGKQGNILHCDLYRLESEDDVIQIGLLEMLNNHITLIEWPHIIKSLLPVHTLHITCSIGEDKNTRRLSLLGVSDWITRLSNLQEIYDI